MQPHGSLGNRKTQTDTACLAIARVIYSIKRTKDFRQRLLRHSSAVVAHGDHSRPFIRPLVLNLLALSLNPALQFNFNLRAFGRVLDGIAHNVFDSATKEWFTANDDATHGRFEVYRPFAAA